MTQKVSIPRSSWVQGPCLLLFVGCLTVPALHAQTKLSGTEQCEEGGSQSVDVGKQRNHWFQTTKQECTWTQPIQILQIAAKDEVRIVFKEEYLAPSKYVSRERGSAAGTMSNGDTYYIHWQQTTASRTDGPATTVVGKWSFSRGSGKLRGIQGHGVYKAHTATDGTLTVEMEGDYQIPR